MKVQIKICILLLILCASSLPELLASAETDPAPPISFPTPLSAYQDKTTDSIWDILVERAGEEPFNLVASILFFCAILHTFLAGQFIKWSHRIEREHLIDWRKKQAHLDEKTAFSKAPVHFKAAFLHFMGEVEAVFGIWLIPLILAIVWMKDWSHVTYYFDHVNYAEPIFVVIIMALASTKPVIRFAEFLSSKAAALGSSTTAAWWFSILTIVPLLGSFITEPAAMTIAATLLALKFYQLKPSTPFMYATLGALFVNISIGGTLTHFAAPPVVMVAQNWNIGTLYMLEHIGWKALLGILIINTLYFFVFRKEFQVLDEKVRQSGTQKETRQAAESIPFWVTAVHLAFMAWVVFNLHHPSLVLGGFLFFLAFVTATKHHQDEIGLRGPLLVGFFLAALVTHGGFQSWWLAPVLSRLGELPLYLGSTLLTAFNDNAAITYLASLVPSFDPQTAGDPTFTRGLQYAVLTGALTGGGLTVIANAPNPAGQSILNKYFKNGISPLGLLAGALLPTLIAGALFLLIKTI